MKRLLLILVLASSPALWADSDEQHAGVGVVAKLYRDYAWEALMEDAGSATLLVEAEREVLEQYFTAHLAALIVADRECTERMQGICALGFAPLWDSQDPRASALTVRAGAGADRVEVSYLFVGTGERIEISHVLSESEPGLWRIADIEYREGDSLVERFAQSQEWLSDEL